MDNSRTASELYYPGEVSVSLGEESFSSEKGLLIAVAAAMIGLGNILRFPALAGAHGGLVFFFAYGICLVLIGFPLLRAELYSGLMIRNNKVALRPGLRALDKAIAVTGVSGTFLCVSYCFVFPGWILKYFILSLGGAITSTNTKDMAVLFNQVSGNVSESILYSSIFMLLSAVIVVKGILFIQWFSKRALMIMVIIGFVFLVQTQFVEGAVSAIWTSTLQPNPSKISFEMLVKAITQVLFSLSLGMGVMRAYAAHAPSSMNSIGNGFAAKAIWMDLSFSILMCLSVYPLIHALGYDAGMGPEMALVNLPAAFSSIQWGEMLIPLFFLMLLLGAFNTMLAFVEVLVSFLSRSLAITRVKSTVAVISTVLALNALSIMTAKSTQPILLPILQYSQGHLIAWVSIVDWTDLVSSYLLLPLCAILGLVRFYWFQRSDNASNITGSSHLALECVRKVLAPTLIVMMSLYYMGLLVD